MPQTLQHLEDFLQVGVAEAGTYPACRQQLAVAVRAVVVAQDEGAEAVTTALRFGPAADHELLGRQLLNFQPVGSAFAGPIPALQPFGHNSLPALAPGPLLHRPAAGHVVGYIVESMAGRLH